MALMTTHVWSLLTRRNSIWVEWIHEHKIKGQSFWKIRLRGNSTTGWRNIMNLRDRIRPFIVSKIGNGLSTYAWSDNWSCVGPLCAFISSRQLHRAGFNPQSKVKDFLHDGVWRWPRAWLDMFPVLINLQPPTINIDVPDSLVWRVSGDVEQDYSASVVWDTIRFHGIKVPWVEIVWFANCIPRHAFLAWLICKKKLKTQDKLKQWDVGSATNLNLMSCPLCCSEPDSHEHLFFECSFSMQEVPAKKSMRSVIGRLLLAATAYFIWQERNHRLFKSKKRSVAMIGEAIVAVVRLKLASVKVKSSTTGMSLLERWKVPIM
ncbi:uncharacterized protein LOC110933405 [Helianthus annuus]|uniref:uncharacterized protein LOC110933405 n=1 Tax=Helianthus annuus TaxID=4232 RepID=UPI000B8F90FA|nr:uncharacterized protein LOC110933405 [Helianthus annuus]